MFIGLQQRLLSSIEAFARTLEVHRKAVAARIVERGEACQTARTRSQLVVSSCTAGGR